MRQSLSKLRTQLLDPHLREILLGSVVGLGVKILSAVSLFLMNILIARSLGATEAGLFFLGFTLITITAAIGRLGLDQGVVRFIAALRATEAFGQLHSVYRKALSWVMAASLLITLIAWLGSEWIVKTFFNQPGFEPVFRVIVLGIPLLALYIMQAQALQGLKQVAQSMLTLSVMMPVSLLIMLLLFPVNTAMVAAEYLVAASLLTLLIGWVLWLRSAPKATSVSDFPSRQLFNTCMPLWVVTIFSQIIQWSSQLMLGSWGTAEEIAYFATAQRTAMLTSFVLFAVNAIAAPKFAAMHAKGDYAGLKHLATWSVRLMLLAAVPALFIMLLFPEWLMSFFGEEFRAASTALMILAIGQFINIATGSVGYLLSMTGHEKELRNNAVVSAIIAVGLGLLLIPTFGLLGATLATATAIATQNLLCVYQVRKHLGFNTMVFWR